MKKNYLFLFFIFIYCSSLFGQYGNEWIRFDQQYFKFPIIEKGVYRIDYSALQNSGFPINSIDPRNIQIFSREKEIAIYVKGQDDGVFNSTDYIEFYAEGNDGWIDSLLYNQKENIGNGYYSLFNDTINYYVTYNNSLLNNRVEEFNDVDFNGYNSKTYIWEILNNVFSSVYYFGEKDVFGISSSIYTSGEGWFAPQFGLGGQFLSSFNLNEPYLLNPSLPFSLETSVSSNSNASGSNNHHLNIDVNNVNLVDEVYSGYQTFNYNLNFNASLINSNNLTVKYSSVNDLGVASDYQAVPYSKITYARTLTDFENQTFYEGQVDYENGKLNSFLEMNNFSTNENAVIYTLNGKNQRIRNINNGINVSFLVPNRTNQAKTNFVAVSESEIKSVSILSRVSNDGYFTDYLSKALSDAYIMIYHNKLESSANQYKLYRQSTGHNVVDIEVNELYDQFGGGVPSHSIAIKRFMNFIYDQWVSKPKNLLLVGKGIRQATESAQGQNPGTRKSFSAYEKSLVPSIGYPASDILYIDDLIDLYNIPISIGRLSVNSNEELTAYLNKVIEYESAFNQPQTLDNKQWMKNIIHFGGGGTLLEQNLFKSFLNNYKNIIENPMFGGDVSSHFKTSSDPIGIIESDEINDRIKKGVSLMCFFGHGSGSGFDANIDSPDQWDNKGKYPLMIANSCYTGDIFQPTTSSSSEEFVLTPDAGSIAYLASVNLGISSYLNLYTQNLYTDISSTNYGVTIGENIRNTIVRSLNQNSSSTMVSTVYSIAYHGDPALKTYSFDKPDISINRENVFITPTVVSPSDDSLFVKVIVSNIGSSFSESFSVNVTRILPDNSTQTKSVILNGLNYNDSIIVGFPLDLQNAVGTNLFNISADLPINEIDELEDYNNNELNQIPYYISGFGVLPLYPYEFEVIPTDTVSLIAQSLNYFTDNANYLFQIDTSVNFNSSLMEQGTVNSNAGVFSFKPSLQFSDSTVYFWRVRREDAIGEWALSSFRYINNQRGWSQASFRQFDKDKFTGIYHDTLINKNTYLNSSMSLNCQVQGSPVGSIEYAATSYSLNGTTLYQNGCGVTASFYVSVIDPITLEPWGTYGYEEGTTNYVNADKQFGNANNDAGCGITSNPIFIFRQNSSAQLDAFYNMINNEVPDGYHILVYTWNYADFSNWSLATNSIDDLFASMGAGNINSSLPQEVPFIFYTKKGDNASTLTNLAINPKDFITFQTDLYFPGFNGNINSTLIGPSKNWDKLFWFSSSEELNSEDSLSMNIYAVNELGDEILVKTINQLNGIELSLDNLVPSISYPYLKLEVETEDAKDATPPQLNDWTVVYDQYPDAAIAPNIHFYISSDSVTRGEPVDLSVAIKNITPFDMDSILVSYFIVNSLGRFDITYPRQKPLKAFETLIDTVTFNTENLYENSLIYVDVNPVVNPLYQYDQREYTRVNNTMVIDLTVSKDEINPLLDVTFDGNHIINGDIVSAKPEIRMVIQDENPYLLFNELSDTINFSVFVINPLGEQKKIPFSVSENENTVLFIPAADVNNRAELILRGEFPEDGNYQLIVQATDKSGNKTSVLDYKINFEIINESSISNVYNYPNPFTTKTQFVFTLTGDQVPDDMFIQIMTITGKVVKEIYMDELGPIHIGHNKTDYTWDGTDMYGDRLATGVYLYRVVTKINNEEINHLETSGDNLFKKGWGKMYLMR